MALEDRQQIFRRIFDEIVSAGGDRTRAAALCVPLLTGADPGATRAQAYAELGIAMPAHVSGVPGVATDGSGEKADVSATPVRPPQKEEREEPQGAGAAAAAVASPALASVDWLSEFTADLSEGLTIEKLETVERECAAAGDYARLVTLVRGCFASAECMRRSFQIPSAVPSMNLGDAGGHADAGTPSTEKRARMEVAPSTPPAPSMQRGRSAGGLTPSSAAGEPVTRTASSMLTSSLPSRTPSTLQSPAAAASATPGGLDGDAMQLDAPPALPADSSTPAPTASAAGDLPAAPARPRSRSPADVAPLRPTPAAARVLSEEFSTPALTAAAASRAGGAGLTPSSPYMGLPPCTIDLPAVLSAYTLIERAAASAPAVGEALAKAQATLASYLHSNAARASEASFVAPIFIVACNPQLEDPTHHEAIVAKLFKAYMKLKKPLQQALGHWFATVGGGHELLFRADDPMAHVLSDHASATAKSTAPSSGLATSRDVAHGFASNAEVLPALAIKRAVDTTQQYITVRLYKGDATVEDVAPPVNFLGILNAANEEYFIIHGKRAIPFEAFYNDVVVMDISLKEDYRRWLSERRGGPSRGSTTPFSFCSHPCILDAAAKSTILQLDAQMQMAEMYRTAMLSSLFGGADNAPFLQLKIRRDNLLEDALRGIVSIENKTALKRPLKVKFEGEEGLDEGGVRKEFFSLMFRQLLTPDFGMFLEETDTKALWFNADSLEANIQFELVGSLLGLAIYNSVILDVNFPLVVYRKLKRETVTLRDLEDFRPQIARNLRALLEYDGDDFEDVFGLNFTVTYESWGAPVTKELVPGGADKAVTKANCKAYIHAYLRWALVDSIAPQFDAFARGFNNVAGGPALDLFRAEELQLLVVGSQELDFKALEGVAEYEAPYSAAHPTIRNFWEVVHSLTSDQKRKFLKFSTGSDRAPIRGLGSMRFIVDRAGPDSDRLVSASTCFQFVHLPEYASKEKMRDKLTQSIEYCEGFGVI